MKEGSTNPLHAANSAPRCTAKSKRSGQACRNAAVTGWNVCRMHGARGGAKEGTANPAWKHGGRTREAMMLRRMVNDLGREARRIKEEVLG